MSTPRRRRKTPSKIPADTAALREELFAIVAVATCLARVIDDEFVPAAALIGRIADGVADALAGDAS